MQLQGELVQQNAALGADGYKPPYRNFPHAFYKICRDEGLRGIQAGLLPGLLYQVRPDLSHAVQPTKRSGPTQVRSKSANPPAPRVYASGFDTSF